MNKIFNLPLVGRVGVATDRWGTAENGFNGTTGFSTNLMATVLRRGRPVLARDVMNLNWLDKFRFGDRPFIDLGSGLTTNVGALAIANDFNQANPSGVANTALALANNHISGTGTNAAAATDITLQTISANGGQTPAAGTQTLVTAANLQKVQTVATLSYTGSEAVTEWGLITASSASATTGTPLTAISATTGTVTGTPLTASSSTVAGQQLHIIRTTTTASWGFILSNTTSVLSLANNGTTGWWKVSDGTAGTTPGSTEAYTIYPVLIDHKVFSAINVINGDSIQFTYLMTVASGN